MPRECPACSGGDYERVNTTRTGFTIEENYVCWNDECQCQWRVIYGDPVTEIDEIPGDSDGV